MSILAKTDILALLKSAPPLIESYIDLDAQLQTNGFDLSLRSVSMLTWPRMARSEARTTAALMLVPPKSTPQ